MSQNQLPILSRDQIDDIAESYLADFQPEALKEPIEVDVEGFLEIYLESHRISNIYRII